MNNLSRISNSHQFQGRNPDSVDAFAPVSRTMEGDLLFERARVLVVDADLKTLDHIESCLKECGIEEIQSCFDPQEASLLMGFLTPDIVLVDVSNGPELLQSVRRITSLQATGIIITGEEINSKEKLAALELGASAFLSKPINPVELVLSIRNIIAAKAYHDHLAQESSRLACEVHQRMMELEQSRNEAEEARKEAMRCLARAAEFRDNDTSNHVLRVGRYVAVMAHRFGFDKVQIEMLEQAAHLHDVGKIGVSDTILLKPGKLTNEEFDKMRQHCEFGSNIILPMNDEDWHELLSEPERTFEIANASSAPIMKLAALIARTHHEKWDGTGYPNRLSGEAIPLVGRITAIADVFDALSTSRPYKQAFSIEKCFAIIREGRGNHFDPAVVDAFFDAENEILQTRDSLSD